MTTDADGAVREESSAALHRLLQETLADEGRRLEALEERVRRLRSRQHTQRPLERSEREEGDAVTDGEIEAARRLLAESGAQLRELEEKLLRLEEPAPAPGFRPPVFDADSGAAAEAAGSGHDPEHPEPLFVDAEEEAPAAPRAFAPPSFDAESGRAGGDSGAFRRPAEARRPAERPANGGPGGGSGSFRAPSEVTIEQPAAPRGFVRGGATSPDLTPSSEENGSGAFRRPAEVTIEQPAQPRAFREAAEPESDELGGDDFRSDDLGDDFRSDDLGDDDFRSDDFGDDDFRAPAQVELEEPAQPRGRAVRAGEEPEERGGERSFAPPSFDPDSGGAADLTRSAAVRLEPRAVSPRAPTRRLDAETTERYGLDRAFGEGNPPDWKRLMRQQAQILASLDQLREELLPGVPPAAPRMSEEERRALVERAERAERACAQALEQAAARVARLESLAAALGELDEEARGGAARELVDLLRSGRRER